MQNKTIAIYLLCWEIKLIPIIKQIYFSIYVFLRAGARVNVYIICIARFPFKFVVFLLFLKLKYWFNLFSLGTGLWVKEMLLREQHWWYSSNQPIQWLMLAAVVEPGGTLHHLRRRIISIHTVHSLVYNWVRVLQWLANCHRRWGVGRLGLVLAINQFKLYKAKLKPRIRQGKGPNSPMGKPLCYGMR